MYQSARSPVFGDRYRSIYSFVRTVSRRARAFCAGVIAVALCAGLSFGGSVSLTSGTSGTLTGVPQSFNETRGIDVTVLSASAVHVVSMRLDGLVIGSASSALVGARIYDSGSGLLLASSNVTVNTGGSVTVPISMNLVSGGNFRMSFYVATTPPNQGAATMFDPDPPGSGGFPYTESTGQLRINNAYDISTDSFPTNTNIFVPQITLDVLPPIDLTSGTTGTLTSVPQSFNETRGVDVTVLSGSGVHVVAMTLDGLVIDSASSALVGARIYDSSNGLLVASSDVTVHAGGSVSVPISTDLVSGGNFRMSVYVATTPPNQGAATMFDPDPPSSGGFPYTESTGQLRINNAYDIASDAFPTFTNIFVPQITITEGIAPGTPFCFGDGTGTACPCANSGALGHGCENSSSTGGSLLTASGYAVLSADTLQFTASGEKPTALSTFWQGHAGVGPLIYGDGLRCVGVSLKRLRNEAAVGGVAIYPDGSETPVALRSAALGDPISLGETRVYQVSYRDPSPTFCASPPGGTFNISGAIRIVWGP